MSSELAVWSFVITHPDGTREDLGRVHNLLTNAGRDLRAAAEGNAVPKGGSFTAATATSATPGGGGMTTDQYKGWRVYATGAAITDAPVYGNIGSNSATVLTVDTWWASGTDTPGAATPSATAGYVVQPGVFGRFLAVSTDATAAAATDTTLTSEVTTGGLGRKKATYAHTAGTADYTLTAAFSVTASFTIRKAALLTASTTAAAGVMVRVALLPTAAVLVAGVTFTVTATVSITG